MMARIAVLSPKLYESPCTRIQHDASGLGLSKCPTFVLRSFLHAFKKEQLGSRYVRRIVLIGYSYDFPGDAVSFKDVVIWPMRMPLIMLYREV
jgi:hypothetical protein